MGKENIIERIWHSIVLFISTITGRENRLLTYKLIAKLDGFAAEFEKTSNFIKEISLKQANLIYQVKKKAFFPVLINSRGKAINLSLQRDIKADFIYEPVNNTLIAELIIDRDKFESFRIDMEKSYKDSPAKVLLEYANELFKKRDREFMDSCSYNFILKIIKYTFDKEMLSHWDIMELLGISILEIAKPKYIAANDLEDFVIDKGPVYKKKEEKIDDVLEATEKPGGTQ